MKSIAVVVLGLSLLVGGRASALTLSVEPASQSVAPSTSVAVAISISGLGDAQASLGGFDLEVSFDSGLLSFSEAVFGDPALGDQLDLFGLGSIIDLVPGSGSVNVLELSLDSAEDLDSLQADQFTLVTLTFFAGESAGSSPIGIAVLSLSDAAGDPLLADIDAGTVEVVPEPASGVLIGAAAALLARARRRDRSRRVSGRGSSR